MRLNNLVELQVLRKISQTKLEKKDPGAWKKIEELGKAICKKWKTSKTSLQLISEGRR